MYARYRFLQYAAICHYRPFVYVSGVHDWVKSWNAKSISSTEILKKKKSSYDWILHHDSALSQTDQFHKAVWSQCKNQLWATHCVCRIFFNR
jgi:hypothetical protein